MAMTAQHQPGDNSIDEVTPSRDTNGAWVIRWRWWPYDGSPAKDFRHRGRTRGDALAKARTKLKELEAGTTGGGRWSKSSSTSAYIAAVVKPAIENSSKLADGSKDLYLRSLTLIDNELGRYPIATATEFRTAEQCLLSIAAAHGTQSAKTARNVLNRWIFGQMRRDKLIAQSPLAGMDIDLGTNKTTSKPSNDIALPEADYDRLLDHLLGIDVDAVELPLRSRAAARARLRTTIDATLLQMTTGIRLGSVRTIEPHEVIDNSSNGINIFIPADKLKRGSNAGRAKLFTVLDDRVADRMRARRDATPAGAYVFGSPADRTRVWDRRNATRSIEDLYTDLAAKLKIKELEAEIRSHGWRTTLNMIHHDLPAHVRADWFGHSEAVNAAHYVDPTADLSPMVQAAKERRAKKDQRDTL